MVVSFSVSKNIFFEIAQSGGAKLLHLCSRRRDGKVSILSNTRGNSRKCYKKNYSNSQTFNIIFHTTPVPKNYPYPAQPETPLWCVLRADINFTKTFGIEIEGFQPKQIFYEYVSAQFNATEAGRLFLGHPVYNSNKKNRVGCHRICKILYGPSLQ